MPLPSSKLSRNIKPREREASSAATSASTVDVEFELKVTVAYLDLESREGEERQPDANRAKARNSARDGFMCSRLKVSI